MIDAQEARCGNLACGKILVLIAAHRRRQYCSDTCKMAAHRARIAAENQARYEALQLELAQREREELRQRWGDLLPEAFDLPDSDDLRDRPRRAGRRYASGGTR